jgi:hypothetical protein
VILRKESTNKVGVVTSFHQENIMLEFFKENVGNFVDGSTYDLEICTIWTLPRFKCQLYEFQPKESEFAKHMALENGKFVFSKPKCIPLALSQSPTRHSKHQMASFEAYVDQLVDENLEDFAKICYSEMDDSFLEKLLGLLVRYRDQKEVCT